MAILRLSVAEWERYHRQLGPRLYQAGVLGVRSAALRIIVLMVKRTREAMPASAMGQVGAVNTGELLRAWKWIAIVGGARILNAKPYSSIVEYGRRPGARRPPIPPIEQWLRRRLQMSEEDAASLAPLVAAAIGRRGLYPRQILTGPDAAAQIRQILDREVRAEIREALARRP